ncbi:MAG: prepilin-type N-terminal cleavage/methylation domain-containing protein [Clostridium sp.]|nr:prepilin-type N-terminal cleavage/methylation domain-containing protein [Clostridium sp.]
MNKKGFTLVELLAVIAILAILVIIALPNVLKMFNDSKKNSFVNETREVFKTAQTQFVSDNLANPGAVTYSNNLGTGNACNPATKKLDMQGRAVDGGQLAYSISLDAEGNVTSIKVSDGTYSYSGTSLSDASAITADSVTTGDAYADATCTQ